MREIDWEKERNRKSPMTPFKAAAIICSGIGFTFTASALGYRVYESVQKKEVASHEIKTSYAKLDAEKNTPNDIDLQPMP